jgi:putative DNA primase/helicase
LLLNGIEGVVSRGDLIDRSLVVYLPVIPEDQRRPETEFWKDFRLAQPRILGALLDAVVCASHRLEEVKLERLPRMADFARWMVAAEPSLGWPGGTFMAAYDANRRSANALALEASLIVRALRRACAGSSFKGTASELLRKLLEHADPQDITQKAWPKDGWALSKQLRGIAPNLRSAGLDVHFGEKTAGSGSKRIITIMRIGRVKPAGVAQGHVGPDGRRRFPRLPRRFPRLPIKANQVSD